MIKMNKQQFISNPNISNITFSTHTISCWSIVLVISSLLGIQSITHAGEMGINTYLIVVPVQCILGDFFTKYRICLNSYRLITSHNFIQLDFYPKVSSLKLISEIILVTLPYVWKRKYFIYMLLINLYIYSCDFHSASFRKAVVA